MLTNLAVLDKNIHCTSLGVKLKVTEFFSPGQLCTKENGQMESVRPRETDKQKEKEQDMGSCLLVTQR